MSLIRIEGMSFYAGHGCFEEEQAIGTRFRVDLTMRVDTSKAEQSDELNDTVNYSDVYQVVKREMNCPSHLLEHVAHRIVKSVLHSFVAVEEVSVKVSKLNPPLGGQMDAVSVELTLGR